jgi:hypothetical protein
LNFPSSDFHARNGIHVALHSDCLANGAAEANIMDRLRRIAAQLPSTKTVGETSMDLPLERKTPDLPATETTSSELIKLVHKLRWAGMEEEAERLLKKWEHRQLAADESVVATPTETD